LAKAGLRTAVRLTTRSRLPALHSLLPPETAKQDLSWDREAALQRAETILVMWQAPLQLMLRANSQSRANLPAQARQLALQ
jgi:hypothetical protein